MSLSLSLSLSVCVRVCLSVCVCLSAPQCACGDQGVTCRSLSLLSGGQTKIIKLGSKHLYPVSPLVGPFVCVCGLLLLFETGSHYGALAVLEFTRETRLTSATARLILFSNTPGAYVSHKPALEMQK